MKTSNIKSREGDNYSNHLTVESVETLMKEVSREGLLEGRKIRFCFVSKVVLCRDKSEELTETKNTTLSKLYSLISVFIIRSVIRSKTLVQRLIYPKDGNT